MRITDKKEMSIAYQKSKSDYEKLQIFRVVNDSHDNSIIRKYINESFHIENEYICQLNPRKYEVIPEFVIEECNKYFC